MKKLLTLAILAVAISFQACAPSKEMVASHTEATEIKTAQSQAQTFFNLLVEGKYQELSQSYSKASLTEFRTAMSFMDSIPAEMKTGFFTNFFSGEVKEEDLKKLSDADYFAKFLAAIMDRAKLSSGMTFKKIDVLGGVKEGDKVHMVTVSHIVVQGEEDEAKEVQTFVKEGELYKAIISEDMMSMAKQFKAMAEQAMAQQSMMQKMNQQQSVETPAVEAPSEVAVPVDSTGAPIKAPATDSTSAPVAAPKAK